MRHKDLTHKTSKLRQREMSMGILTTEKKKDVNKIKYVRRNIHHPYFKNVSRNGAMAALKDEEVGEIIIRPSSQGMDLLTITRKVPCMSCVRARARAHMHALCAHACACVCALACADDPVWVIKCRCGQTPSGSKSQ